MVGLRTAPPLLLVVLLAVLPGRAATGGSGNAGGAPAEEPAGDAVPRIPDDLLVVLDRGDGSPSERYTLVCTGAASGDHPRAQAACDHLQAMADPFAPVPDDAVCTEVYGGPQTAHVDGVWRGRPVDLRLSRVDGCRIAQWDSLGPLLPG